MSDPKSVGRIVKVAGPVVDAEFPPDGLPEILHAVEIDFELLGTNSLGELCMATPAISNDLLIVRAKSHVYGIGEPRSRAVELASSSMEPGHRVRQRRCDSGSGLWMPIRSGVGLLRECLTGGIFRRKR